jgi:hypothetical protein
MKEADADIAYPDDVVARVRLEAFLTDSGRAFDPLELVRMGVDRDIGQFQQFGDAHDGMPEEVSPEVIRVIVSCEHADEAHPVGLEQTEQFTWGIRGIDYDRLTLVPVSYQVHEIHHLASHGVVLREVAPSQKLSEVKRPVGHVVRGSGDQSASLLSRRSFEKTSTMGRLSPIRRWSRSMASS